MHMVIRAIVYASNEQMALAKAHEIFDRLCNNGDFDYHRTFETEGTCVSGRGRWGDIPAVSRADSEEGKCLIEDGMVATIEEFNKHMKEIRFIVDHFSDEEIFENQPDRMLDPEMQELARSNDIYLFSLRYSFLQVGKYSGPSVWLYDNDGEAIRTKGHLNDVLNKWRCLSENSSSKYDGLDVWVVPADVHF